MTLSARRRAIARRWFKSAPPAPVRTACDAAWRLGEVRDAVRRWLRAGDGAVYSAQLPGQIATFRREERRIDGVVVDAAVDGENARTVYACAPRG